MDAMSLIETERSLFLCKNSFKKKVFDMRSKDLDEEKAF
ncbi:hypothetical protein M452_0211280 [Staphylococcus epidermidis APO35]|nr:hypothetical protein M452_0211280 [Staphylococcus epidermidis APO35]ESV10036.1 hypothetical protein M456_0206260 [Staphylococcus epidermidis MC28]ESV42562.1 hypothetical protein M455_0207830 [Staphylococcus epidermidis MC19]ESV47019.1 hypothetical protein M457_0206660 [Staphylococcus epidermidis Scl19]